MSSTVVRTRFSRIGLARPTEGPHPRREGFCKRECIHPEHLIHDKVERRLSCITDRDISRARSQIEDSTRADDIQRDSGVCFTPFR